VEELGKGILEPGERWTRLWFYGRLEEELAGRTMRGILRDVEVEVQEVGLRRSSRSAQEHAGYRKGREVSAAQKEKRGAPRALLER
jgi:hypothetical protein